jgi:predicted ATP-grasp superfamily ATP-dependent carboligase
MKAEYLSETTRKNEKTRIAANIVWTIRNANSPGRFLKQDSDTNLWYEIGDKAAFRKTGQALRENSAEFIRSWEGKAASNRIGLAVIHPYDPQQTCVNAQRSSLSGLDAIAKAAM